MIKQPISSKSIQPAPQPSNSITSIKSNTNLSQIQASVVYKQFVTDAFVIDPNSIKLPFVAENYPKNEILKAVCPKIRKSQFEILCVIMKLMQTLVKLLLQHLTCQKILKVNYLILLVEPFYLI